MNNTDIVINEITIEEKEIIEDAIAPSFGAICGIQCNGAVCGVGCI